MTFNQIDGGDLWNVFGRHGAWNTLTKINQESAFSALYQNLAMMKKISFFLEGSAVLSL